MRGFATTEMHGIENRWRPLEGLFADDNSDRGLLVQRVCGSDAQTIEYSSVSSLRSCGTMSSSDQSDTAALAASAAGLHWTFAG